MEAAPTQAVPVRDRDKALLAVATLATIGLQFFLRGGATALAVGYLLTLVVALAYGVPSVLGARRTARGLAGATLVLGIGLAFAPAEDPSLEEVSAVLSFPDGRSRAFHELAPPAGWQGRGKAFVYVGVAGDVARVLSAGPILEVDGRRLALARALERGSYLRAPFPEEKLGTASVELSFGFEGPSNDVGLRCTLFHTGTLPRAPSRFSPDGTRPPPGPPLVRRRPGAFDSLLGRATFEQPRAPLGPGVPPLGRYALELWLLGPDEEVLDTCR